ncbi:MAG: mycofactocin radical SAM maturase [Candidatus Goldbacteria bacterium]|nr:mycofactocin radical SAM maturase [Candidatus Goldiibacteriota bacterium]
MIHYSELLSAPVNITWEITKKCNLNCTHCLSFDLQELCTYELTFEQCKVIIDELSKLQVFQINFGGGEPFLREDFIDILYYVQSKNITACISTNAIILNKTIVDNLIQIKDLYIQVSLDGATERTNDLIRGKNTFKRIISGIELLLNNGFPSSNMSTNTVVTSINFMEIPEIYNIGRRYGIKTRLSRFRPSGNAKKVWQEYRLSKQQLEELVFFLNAYKDVLTGDSFFSITSEERSKLGLNICGAAKLTCSVQPDGSVYPCAFLQDKYFKAGNILENSLKFIWDNSYIFKKLRRLRIQSCENCERFNICHGGCPAVAFFLTNSVYCSDPECIKSIRNNKSEKHDKEVTNNVYTI